MQHEGDGLKMNKYLWNPFQMKYENLDHELTAFQPESYALINHWRELLDNYGLNDGKPK